MPTIALMASKGGTGKTTLAANLAVAAMQAGKASFLVDLDSQKSLTDWFRSREADEPQLVETPAERMGEVLPLLPAGAFVFIDTPPRTDETALAAARLADLVIVPARPTAHDLGALRHISRQLASISRRGFVVLNQCPAGRGGEASSVSDARAALAAYADALDVAPVAIGHRAAFTHSAVTGLAVQELEPAGKAADEIKEAWRWLRESLP